MVVDSHVHIISPDSARYPLSPLNGRLGAWVREMPTSVEGLLQRMDTAGIDRAVVVQAATAYHDVNDYVADSVRDHPERLTGVCIVDMQSVEAEYRLSYWVEERGMRGVRLYATNDLQDTWLDAPRTFGVWVRAELLDIPICVQTFTHHLPKLRAMLERYPNVRVALDHLADYHGEANGHEAAAQALLPLAELPRLYLKFSAANLLAFRAAGADTKGIFDMLLEHFGPQRLIWGSNFPATYTHSRTRRWWASARKRWDFWMNRSCGWCSGSRRWHYGRSWGGRRSSKVVDGTLGGIRTHDLSLRRAAL